MKGLSLLVFLPALGAGALLLVPRRAVSLLFSAAFGVSLLAFLQSLWIFWRFDPNVAEMQMVERLAWIPSYGIEYIVGVDDVDVLIFASAGQDLIEPATANIVQEKLGTACQAFDVKNACNSFLNGLQLAESLILSGAYSQGKLHPEIRPSDSFDFPVPFERERGHPLILSAAGNPMAFQSETLIPEPKTDQVLPSHLAM